MNRRGQLLALLADGELHSGEALARALGVTRSAIAKQVRSLAPWGLRVEAHARRGYRLEAPLELLDAARMQAALLPVTRARLDRLELHEELESTNSRLLAESGLPAGRWRACLAEYQSAGRGRRGRPWLQPYASGLCLSFAWLYDPAPASLGALSLAAGVAALRALARHGAGELALKWPNDIQCHGGKLGGILAELRFEAAGPAYVVVGLGLNVRLPAGFAATIEAAGGVRPADLADIVPLPSRTRLAATLLDELSAAMVEFGERGFAPFAAEWSRCDALRDRPVRVQGPATTRDGFARGIDAQGSLRVEFAGQVESLTAGEVTLRAVA